MNERERGRFIQCNTNYCLVQGSQKHDQRDYLSKELAAIFGKCVGMKCRAFCVKNNKETFTTGTVPLYVPDEFQLLICCSLSLKGEMISELLAEIHFLCYMNLVQLCNILHGSALVLK